ncbi:hypothetical protein ILUMI_14926 [Ignelater luminosus]|uniref:HTH psq-type domain-containing protein n=1 Tax=Ignelater luminosus TaxID=2038154 RepID=A0A8K0CTA7_IGNLU|nr:hypothetical protein ILUMI_14926 [Ignelater luminosus]
MDRYKDHSPHRYLEEALQSALKAIREENVGIRELNRRFGVSRGTIQDHFHGRFKKVPLKMRPCTILSKEKEDDLERWLIELAEFGFP